MAGFPQSKTNIKFTYNFFKLKLQSSHHTYHVLVILEELPKNWTPFNLKVSINFCLACQPVLST